MGNYEPQPSPSAVGPTANVLHIIIVSRRTMETTIQNPAKSRGPTMRNITVAVSDDSYRQARIWAAKNDTSVSAAVQDLLLDLPRLARLVRSFNAGLPTSAQGPDSRAH